MSSSRRNFALVVERQTTGAATELLNMDAEDDGLKAYMEGLLGYASKMGDPSDPRRVIITEMRVIINGQTNDVVYDCAEKGSEQRLVNTPFTLTQKCEFRIQVSFKCQHEIIMGLKLCNFVDKAGGEERTTVKDEEEMLGSFPAGTDIYKAVLPRTGWDSASGMLGSGSYKGRHRFIDSNGKTHLEYEYAFNINEEIK